MKCAFVPVDKATIYEEIGDTDSEADSDTEELVKTCMLSKSDIEYQTCTRCKVLHLPTEWRHCESCDVAVCRAYLVVCSHDGRYYQSTCAACAKDSNCPCVLIHKKQASVRASVRASKRALGEEIQTSSASSSSEVDPPSEDDSPKVDILLNIDSSSA